MSIPSDIQERVAKSLAEEPEIDRSENRMLADGSLEVWLYDVDGVLQWIATVFPDGLSALRPGFRVTTDKTLR